MSKAEGRGQKAEVLAVGGPVAMALLLSAFCLLSSCKTVGISTTTGGYSEVEPTIAAEMILDSQQVVVLDVRPVAAYRGPDGHIAGSLNAPFDTIERQLPPLVPSPTQTVPVSG